MSETIPGECLLSLAERITLALADLDDASIPRDVDLPGYRLHPLKGSLKGMWSIKHNCLEPLGLSVTEGARVLGVARHTLSRVLNSHAAISPEMAIRLKKAGWSTAEFWLRRQTSYDLTQAPRSQDRIKGRALRAADDVPPSFPSRRAECVQRRQPRLGRPVTGVDTRLKLPPEPPYELVRVDDVCLA